jgi:hypothetical protein
MLSLSAYLDASGSVRDPRCEIFTVAGYLAEDAQWASFEHDWQSVLEESGVSHLHMKDFAHSQGEFRDWKDDSARRANFIERLASVIRSNELEDFSVSLRMADYRRLDGQFMLTESLGAYAIIAAAVMGDIKAWTSRHRPSDPLRILFEGGDNQQNDLRRVSERTKRPLHPDPLFVNKRRLESGRSVFCLPFQASDLLAYEHAKCLTDFVTKGKTRARESLFRLSYHQSEPSLPSWRMLDEAFLALVCETFTVPRRTFSS